MKPAHHRLQHQRLARIVVARANADPTTRCQAVLPDGTTCGRTLAEHPYTKTGNPPTWDAGHVHDGRVATSVGDYRPEVSTCNRSAGATTGNRNRIGLRLRHNY